MGAEDVDAADARRRRHTRTNAIRSRGRGRGTPASTPAAALAAEGGGTESAVRGRRPAGGGGEISDDANDPLPIRWIALVGRGAAGTAVATNGTFSIPAGRACFVGAFVASTEHPTWTERMVADTDSKYDDTFGYSLTAGETRLQRRGRVLALHTAFGEGRTANGLSSVAYSGGSFFLAPTGTALEVTFSMEVANADDNLRPTALMLGVCAGTCVRVGRRRFLIC